MKIKQSYGLACCRFKNDTPQILLIKKRVSYAFCEFVMGNYVDTNEYILALFNKMTVDEKLDIFSLNYNQMWYRLWLSTKKTGREYINGQNKFFNTFLNKKRSATPLRLLELIRKSTNGVRCWEIPKGRKNFRNEPEINCAVREFYEETGVPQDEFKFIIGNNEPFNSIIEDNGCRYNSSFYLAIANSNTEARVDLANRKQVNEICAIKWMSIEEIRFRDSTGHLAEVVAPIFKRLRELKKSNRL